MQRSAPLVVLVAAIAGAGRPAAAQVSYTDLTGSIADLGWDGGRTEIELGDLNADGHPDVVTVGDHGSPFIGTQMHGITAWLGDGAGGWTLVQTGDFGYGGLTLGDIDGDGHVDVAFGVHHDYSSTDFGDQLLEVALGDGTGTGWTPWDDGLATNGETWGMFGCDLGDVDGDGDLDLGSVSFGCCAGAHVYRNEGDGTWTPIFGFLNGNSDETFEFGDFDGNGHLDFVAGHQDAAVHLGDGTGAFVLADGNLPSTAWLGVGVGDVDGDGADELSFRNSSGGLEVWTWTSGNAWVPMTGDLPASGAFEATELVDMDVDGQVDLAAFGEGLLAIHSWQPGNDWTQIFSGVVPGEGPKSHEAFRAGVDVDHNGFPDLAVVQDESSGPFGGSNNRLHVIAEASAPAALEPHLAAPGAARTWIGGQARFVDWTCAVPAGDQAVVDLELSTSGPAGPWSPLATGIPNGGRHQLVVPTDVQSSSCHVRITVTSQQDQAQEVGPAFTIAPPGGVLPAAVLPYGCDVNPAGSLTVLAGLPQLGATLTLGLDNPLGTQALGSATLLALATQPDPSFPCGTLLPGSGMAGPGASGELLLSVVPPDPILPPFVGPAWNGAPAPIAIAIPVDPTLLGASLYAQGVIVDPIAAQGVPLGLTGAAELRFGP